MAVTFDNVKTKIGAGVETLTTDAFTIAADANRVAILGMSFSNTGIISLRMLAKE